MNCTSRWSLSYCNMMHGTHNLTLSYCNTMHGTHNVKIHLPLTYTTVHTTQILHIIQTTKHRIQQKADGRSYPLLSIILHTILLNPRYNSCFFVQVNYKHPLPHRTLKPHHIRQFIQSVNPWPITELRFIIHKTNTEGGQPNVKPEQLRTFKWIVILIGSNLTSAPADSAVSLCRSILFHLKLLSPCDTIRSLSLSLWVDSTIWQEGAFNLTTQNWFGRVTLYIIKAQTNISKQVANFWTYKTE